MTNYYSVNLDLSQQKCLVIGGGKVAERKVETLLECGGLIKLISPSLTPKLRELVELRKIVYEVKDFEEKDLKGVFLVIGATDQQEINEKVAKAAFAQGVLVNVVDAAALSNFIVPATHHQGMLAISISTGGASPALAAKIRREIAQSYGPEYGEFLELLQDIRPKVISKYPTQAERKKVFQKMVDSDILDLIREENQEKAKERIAECIC